MELDDGEGSLDGWFKCSCVFRSRWMVVELPSRSKLSIDPGFDLIGGEGG